MIPPQHRIPRALVETARLWAFVSAVQTSPFPGSFSLTVLFHLVLVTGSWTQLEACGEWGDSPFPQAVIRHQHPDTLSPRRGRPTGQGSSASKAVSPSKATDWRYQDPSRPATGERPSKDPENAHRRLSRGQLVAGNICTLSRRQPRLGTAQAPSRGWQCG